MNPSELQKWLLADEPQLKSAIVSDIKRHVDSLRSASMVFYGYAVLPPDYFHAFDPSSMAIAYNCESDIPDEAREAVGSRYFPSEWKNIVHDCFENSNAEIKKLLTKFRNNHVSSSDDFIADASELAYTRKIDRTMLDAVVELKSNKTFLPNEFLIVWYNDADQEVVQRSVEILNPKKISSVIAQELSW